MAEYQKKRQRTRAAIIDSLIEIAQVKGLTNVTVSEIIKDAHINRSTFYRHFLDKPDLIEQIENEILDQIRGQYDRTYLLNQKRLHNSDGLTIMVNIVNQHHQILALLISDKGDLHFRMRLSQLFLETIGTGMDLFFSQVPEKYKTLFLKYTVGAFLAVINQWLTHYDQYTQNDIYDFLSHIRDYDLKGMNEPIEKHHYFE